MGNIVRARHSAGCRGRFGGRGIEEGTDGGHGFGFMSTRRTDLDPIEWVVGDRGEQDSAASEWASWGFESALVGAVTTRSDHAQLQNLQTLVGKRARN